MAHLVGSFVSRDGAYKSLESCYQEIRDAQSYLAALHWARTEPSLNGYVVERCHLTTSSSRGDEDDYDLVLVKEDLPGFKAKFEVSDVVGIKDGNNKEKKDLASLGVLKRGSFQHVDEWPAVRLFLVVSEEFSGWLTRRRTRIPHYSYERVGLVRTTSIVEVTEKVAS